MLMVCTEADPRKIIWCSDFLEEGCEVYTETFPPISSKANLIVYYMSIMSPEIDFLVENYEFELLIHTANNSPSIILKDITSKCFIKFCFFLFITVFFHSIYSLRIYTGILHDNFRSDAVILNKTYFKFIFDFDVLFCFYLFVCLFSYTYTSTLTAKFRFR